MDKKREDDPRQVRKTMLEIIESAFLFVARYPMAGVASFIDWLIERNYRDKNGREDKSR